MEKISYLLNNPSQDKGRENGNDSNRNNGKWLLNEDIAVEAGHNIDDEKEAPVCDRSFVGVDFLGKTSANEDSRDNERSDDQFPENQQEA